MRLAAPAPHVCQRYAYRPRLRSRVVGALVAIAFAVGAIAPPFAHAVAGTPPPRAQTPVVAFAATFVWAAAIAGTWATGANWQVGGVPQAAPPTAADDVLFGSGTGFTQSGCTLAAGDVCRSADFTGYTGTLTHPTSVTWTLSGGLKLVAGMTYTKGSSSSSIILFNATTDNSGAGWPVTWGGKFASSAQFNGVGGKWVFQDALTQTQAANTVQLNNGDLDFGAATHAISAFTRGGSNAVTIRGTGTITFSQSGVVWSLGSASGVTTFLSTITLNATVGAGNTCSLDLGISAAHVYGTITGTVNATGVLQLRRATTTTGTGATINNLVVTAGKVRFRSGVTFTAGSATGWLVSGVAGTLTTVDTETAGTGFTVSCASGTMDWNYVSIKDSTATGGAAFWAENSTNVSGNTGWNFGARRTITDSFTLTDSRTQATSSARTITDTFGLVDSRAQVLNAARTVTDPFGLVDSRAQATAYARTVTDAFGLVDAMTRAVAAARTVTDAFGLADSIARAVTAARSITDPFGLSDSQAQEVAAARTITDVFGLVDSMAREVAAARTVTDVFGVTDSTVRELAAARTITDNFGITDSVARAVAYARTLTDGFALADSIDHALAAARTITDAFSLADSVTRETVTERTITDPFGLADDVTFEHHVPAHLLRGTVRALDRAATAAAGTRAKVTPARTATRQAGQGPRITDR